MESGKWKVESGKWKVENGKWKVESGKWKVENSTSPLRAVAMFFVILSKRSVAKDPYKCKEKSIELNNTKMESWKMESPELKSPPL